MYMKYMKIVGTFMGLILAVLGFWAFMIPMEVFLRNGWFLGVLFIVSGLKVIIPLFIEKRQAKKTEEELKKNPTKKNKKKIKKAKEEAEKKNNGFLYMYAGIELFVGAIFLISGLSGTLTANAAIYLISSCVMVYGWFRIQISMKEKERAKEIYKKTRKEEKPKRSTMATVCNVTSLIAGGVGVCHTFIPFYSMESLIAFNIMLHGFNWIVMARENAKNN